MGDGQTKLHTFHMEYKALSVSFHSVNILMGDGQTKMHTFHMEYKALSVSFRSVISNFAILAFFPKSVAFSYICLDW